MIGDVRCQHVTETLHSTAADQGSTTFWKDEGAFLIYLPTAEAHRGACEIFIWKERAVSHLVIGDLATEPVT